MTKLLFTHSYFYQLDPKQWKFRQPYPPLATILAAAVMRQEGFSVSLFDTNLLSSPRPLVPVLSKEKPEYLVIYDDSFNYLSKMCLTNMRDAAFEMIRYGKAAGCRVIVASSDATDQYEKYLDNGADYVIRGEGEQTLRELVAALETGNATSAIPGIAYKTADSPFVTSARAIMKNLDALPIPAWDLVDIQAYRRIWMKHHGYFSLNIATTRGCPFKCNWCAKPIYGNRYTSRSPGHVAREIEHILEMYKPDHFWMCDDIFGLKPGWVQAFSTIVKTRNLKFKYKIQSRVDLLLEEDTIDSLAESGAETIWVGAESGSQKILDAMEKGTTVRQIHDATALIKQKQLRVGFFLQFGYLGETIEDINDTIKMLLALMPDEVGISVSYPLPGTKFYGMVKDQLKEKQNWSDSDDLAMMFNSTFKHTFYKQLHRYVHAEYRKHKGYESVRKFFGNPLRLSYRDLRSALGTMYFTIQSYVLSRKLVRLNFPLEKTV